MDSQSSFCAFCGLGAIVSASEALGYSRADEPHEIGWKMGDRQREKRGWVRVVVFSNTDDPISLCLLITYVQFQRLQEHWHCYNRGSEMGLASFASGRPCWADVAGAGARNPASACPP